MVSRSAGATCDETSFAACTTLLTVPPNDGRAFAGAAATSVAADLRPGAAHVRAPPSAAGRRRNRSRAHGLRPPSMAILCAEAGALTLIAGAEGASSTPAVVALAGDSRRLVVSTTHNTSCRSFFLRRAPRPKRAASGSLTNSSAAACMLGSTSRARWRGRAATPGGTP
eukprot:scaffold76211_cov64-Phaeocystis_antarctica.AAC.1